MKLNKIALDDLPWIIEYESDKCMLCGKCVASCSFSAIKVGVQKRKKVRAISNEEGFSIDSDQKAIPVIQQNIDENDYCRGCGICTKVCPNGAIRPVRNKTEIFGTRYRSKTGESVKRGGRTNLHTEGRTLDKIKVGRISQMTDPSLDALRHTFDLRTNLGRVLNPKDIDLEIVNGELQPSKTKSIPPNRSIYPILIGDMSIGALSPRMWEAVAIAVAYLNEVKGIPIRMSTGEGGLPEKLLRSRYLKYMILQIASGHFGWNRIIDSMPYMQEDPAGILIKIGQGAKPGDGGLLMAEKNVKLIQEIRGVPKADLLSPPNHQGLYSIEESVQKMFLSLNCAFKFKVPVAVKVAASATSVSVYNNLLRDPYNIVGGFFLDGIAGGTGAAHEISLNHTGHPIVSKLRDCYLTAVRQGKQGQIPLFAAGGVGMNGNLAADAFKLICLGASGVFIGRLVLQMAGCVGNDFGKCNACNTGRCPMGITTQNPKLAKRLDIDQVAQNIVNYICATDIELKKLLAPVGNSTLPIGRSDALICVDKNVADRLDIQHVC
ncbi:MAG: glutamate synthase-related protein [Candidatus Gastranaerophilales bacterium]|nr:glutamate synthase-related protein [Candidatus Gastranaerophilales bacterium]